MASTRSTTAQSPPSALPSTQADVAQYCGVSRSTVAAVLRGEPAFTGVNPDTHERVMHAIAKLGYRPNAAAASLRSGRTHSVAIAVPNMQFTRHIMAPIIMSGIGERAMELGYAFSIACYAEADIRGSFQRLLRESRFDGVFVLALMQDLQDPRSRVLTDLGVPYIALESQAKNASSINFDNVGGARALTRHLIDMGRKKIAFIGHKPDALWSSQRFEGYNLALKEHGIPSDPRLVIPMIHDMAILGSTAVKQLLDSGVAFDSLCCISDVTALAAIRELTRLGIRVPEDIAVTGYDDMTTAALVTPALTTVHQDGQSMGKLAMEMLHKQINRRAKPSHHTLPVTMFIRESCGSKSPRIQPIK